MKVLIAYLSQTGNTKKIAEAVFNEIDCEKNLMTMKDVTSTDGYDIIFAGFPVWSFGPAEPARKFLQEFCKGRKTALLVTHAMPSHPEDERMAQQLGEILQKCEKAAEGTRLIGVFDCQGELSRPVAEFLLKSDNEELRRFGQGRNETVGHPDDADIRNAVIFAREVMEKSI